MKNRKQFDDILNECLDRVLRGEAIEQCLASYPEQADKLKPLLDTALATQKASAVKPSLEFRNRARYEFQQAIRETEARKSRRIFTWQPRWATVLIAVLILVLASGGTVAAASNSMPDEPLYPVKLATEAVQLTLTLSKEAKAELYADLADKRVAEIVRMAEKGKPVEVRKTSERLTAYLAEVASVAEATRKAPLQEEAKLFRAPAAAPAPAPPAIKPQAPAPVPAPEIAKEEEAKKRALDKEEEEAKKSAPGEDTKLDKREKIKEKVGEYAAKHEEALREALEKAPESAKPALRKAIDESKKGYKEALEALD